MEVLIQKCQNCQSDNLKNILYRESGEPDRVFVECQDCNVFVASYVIAPLGYFHNGKGFESFLRGVNRSGGFMSGRRVKNLFAERTDLEVKAFKEVTERLKEKIDSQKSKNK
jgi:hypothetical protein